MGCNNDERRYEAPNAEAAKAQARNLMAAACSEYGTSYGGHIGMCDGVRVHRTAKPLTETQADALLYGDDAGEGLAQKWGPAILVRIRNKGSRKALWLLAGMCSS